MERALGSLVSRWKPMTPPQAWKIRCAPWPAASRRWKKKHGELLHELRANLASGGKPAISVPPAEPAYDPSIFAQKEFAPPPDNFAGRLLRKRRRPLTGERRCTTRMPSPPMPSPPAPSRRLRPKRPPIRRRPTISWQPRAARPAPPPKSIPTAVAVWAFPGNSAFRRRRSGRPTPALSCPRDYRRGPDRGAGGWHCTQPATQARPSAGHRGHAAHSAQHRAFHTRAGKSPSLRAPRPLICRCSPRLRPAPPGQPGAPRKPNPRQSSQPSRKRRPRTRVWCPRLTG